MMERYIKYIAVFAATISVCMCMELSLSADKTDLREGDNVTLTLDIKNYKSGGLIKWIKVNGDDYEDVQIASNFIIGTDYVLRSWKMAYAELNKEIKHYQMSLTIMGVKLEEAGLYRCEWSDGADIPETADAEVTINVIVAPQQIKLFYDDQEIGEGDEFDVEQDSVHKLRCEVLGGAPAPQVDIFAGHTKVSAGKEFTTEAEKKADGEELDLGFYRFIYDVIVDGEQVTFDSKFANKMIKCSVKGPGGQMSSAAFKAKFPGMSPVWNEDCPKEVMSFVGDKNFDLSCDLTASPPAKVDFVWNYRNPAADDEFRISPDMDPADFPKDYIGKLEEVDESTQKATLAMDVIHPNMFRNYTFIAKNELGESEYTVYLAPDPSKEIKTSSTAFASASILLALLSSIFFVLLH